MQYGILKEIRDNHQGEKCSYKSFTVRINKGLPFQQAIIKKPRGGVRYNKGRFDKFIDERKEVYGEPIVSKGTLRARINILYMDVQEAFTKPSMRLTK